MYSLDKQFEFKINTVEITTIYILICTLGTLGIDFQLPCLRITFLK